MRRSRKPFRGRFLRRGFESLPLRCRAKSGWFAGRKLRSGYATRITPARQRTSTDVPFSEVHSPSHSPERVSRSICTRLRITARGQAPSPGLARARCRSAHHAAGVEPTRAASRNADRTCHARLLLPACLVNLRPEPGGRRVFAKVVAKVGQREVDIAVAARRGLQVRVGSHRSWLERICCHDYRL